MSIVDDENIIITKKEKIEIFSMTAKFYLVKFPSPKFRLIENKKSINRLIFFHKFGFTQGILKLIKLKNHLILY